MIETDNFTMATPIGGIKIETTKEAIVSINFCIDKVEVKRPQHVFAKLVKEELQHYFQDPTHVVKLPLVLKGTPFQVKVWKFIKSIPSGKTVSYGTVAKILDSGPRAIGQACRTNKIPLIIPCHRIVAANNRGGFMGTTKGSWPEIKSWLLDHES